MDNFIVKMPEIKMSEKDKAILKKCREEIDDIKYHNELMDAFTDAIQEFEGFISLETLKYLNKSIDYIVKDKEMPMKRRNSIIEFLIDIILAEVSEEINSLKEDNNERSN